MLAKGYTRISISKTNEHRLNELRKQLASHPDYQNIERLSYNKIISHMLNSFKK